jgi:hypothetical protein
MKLASAALERAAAVRMNTKAGRGITRTLFSEIRAETQEGQEKATSKSAPFAKTAKDAAPAEDIRANVFATTRLERNPCLFRSPL